MADGGENLPLTDFIVIKTSFRLVAGSVPQDPFRPGRPVVTAVYASLVRRVVGLFQEEGVKGDSLLGSRRVSKVGP